MEREKSVVLVVEDQKINRQILSRILQFEYDVLEAENGEEAFGLLESSGDIAAILLDIVMPIMDGYTFLARLQESPFASLPVIAITGEKDENAEQKALELGAWDFVSKPYRPTTLLTRLKNVIVRSQFYLVNEMKHAYEHDPLTDLYNRTAFFSETRALLDSHPQVKFALVRFDIDHFQTYNSFWGEEEGDKLLRFIADRLRVIAHESEPCTYARINADAFCICAPYDREVIERRGAEACTELAAYNREYKLVPSLGVYVIDNPGEKIQKMYEFATLAARTCKGNYIAYIGYYRPDMSQRALQDQLVVNEMQNALDARQFEVYLQPKYNLKTGRPYGAEALIRWRHPTKGLLPPGLFIPVFERSGFIGKVDYYVWDCVCALLSRWIREGRQPGPISVNVSRVNLYNPGLTQLLTQLVQKYAVPARLLQLEITESAYMDNPELMSKTVQALQSAGFAILMDDFGSGYSSLNTLKDIRVDVLKVDMKFLSGDSDAERSRCILASVIRMAGWLYTPVITEGVETQQQVEFLKSVGCSYAQGYYYARPMPVSDYEKLMQGVPQTPAQPACDNLQKISGALWAGQPSSELLFNSMEQPLAIYEYDGRHARILRVNHRFSLEFGPAFGIDTGTEVSAHTCLGQGETAAVLAAFARAAETRGTLECTCPLRSPAGAQHSVRMVLQYWGANETSAIIFAQFFLQ